MTGTGGPVLLVPVLLALGVDVLEAIALGTVLGLLAAAGAVVGLALARRVSAARLGRATSLVLVATGGYLVVSTVL